MESSSSIVLTVLGAYGFFEFSISKSEYNSSTVKEYIWLLRLYEANTEELPRALNVRIG